MFRRDLALITVTAAVLAVGITTSGALWRWDRTIYDWLMSTDGEPPPADVLIVAVDEQSLAALGRWPWPRRLHADAVDRLTTAGARAVALAIMFSEPDTESGSDTALVRAIKDNGRIVMPVMMEAVRAGGQLKETLPLPEIAAAAVALGHVDMEVDPDGLVRSTYLRAGLGEPYWPSLAGALLGVAEYSGPDSPVAQNSAARLGLSPYSWLREEQVFISFLGPPGHFPRVPFVDLLEGRVPADLIRDRVVFVGVTAAGLGGQMATPVSGGATQMPAVEVLANVYQGLRTDSHVKPLALTAQGVLAALLVVIPALLYLKAPSHSTIPLGIVTTGVPVAVSAVLMYGAGIWWPPLGAVLGGGLVFAGWNWRRLELTRREVHDGRQRAEATLRSIGDGVVTTDLAQRIDYMNPVAESLTGWKATEAAGRDLNDVVRLVNKDDTDVPQPVQLVMPPSQAASTKNPITLLSRDGEASGVQASVAPIRDTRGSPYGIVVALHDVTDAQRLEREMAHQASHDGLTDLPNWSLLMDRLTTALARAQRAGSMIALLFLDLDRFKTVNDAYGHGFGDNLLRQVATRLRESRRAQDTVARLGGDEFVVVLEDLHDSDGVSSIARKYLDVVSKPYLIEEKEIFVTTSLGVSMFPKDGGAPDALLKAADAAMYRAKDSGRNAVQFFSEEINQRILHRIDLEHRLRRALGDSVLELHYQPLVDLLSDRITGVEALLRWNDALVGPVSPTEFISVAEESGLIVPLGEWVLEAACRQVRAWDECGAGGLRVSVNVSPRQLLQQEICSVVGRVLDSTEVDPARLELEITESVVMQDVDSYERVLRGIRDLGVSIAIDDFGTGYSSLSYLKRFPVNRVKIDQSFVRDIGTNGEGVAISRAIIAMARGLELGVVAEGIENQAQVDFLRARQCEEGQGFFLCPPQPSDVITKRLLAGHGRLIPDHDS